MNEKEYHSKKQKAKWFYDIQITVQFFFYSYMSWMRLRAGSKKRIGALYQDIAIAGHTAQVAVKNKIRVRYQIVLEDIYADLFS